MSILLKVNGRDLSSYIRVANDEGLDPANSAFLEPQFTGAAAFGDGQAAVGASASNRVITVPLILDGTDEAALHQLIRNINNDLARGNQVEFALDAGSSTPTFFDLEDGRLDVDYQYWVARNNRLRATLQLWARPYGHTGTSRLIASAAATAITQVSVTGILGDTDALGKLEVRVGSRVASGGRMIAYGVHRSASFNAIRGPSAPDFVAQSGATVRGGSGAIGSQYLALPVSPTGASGVALTSFLTPAAGHVGRHRVLAVARSRLDRPIAIAANDRFGAPLGPTAFASSVDGAKWDVVDLGEIQVPDRRAEQEPAPTQYVELRAGGASGNIVNASPALEINRLVYLPLDSSPGVLRSDGAIGDDVLFAIESFRDPYSGYGISPPLESFDTDWGAAPWSQLGEGKIGRNPYGVGFVGSGAIDVQPVGNASAAYALGSGNLLGDSRMEAKIWVTGLAACASPVSIELQAKRRSSGNFFALRFIPGPSQTLQLLSRTAAGGASVMASAGIGSTLASGFWLGQPHKLILNADGGELSAYIGTAPANPVLVASHADVSAAGWPGLAMSNASNVASGLLVIDYLWVQRLGRGASDMGPREWFRFEAHPERRTFQGNASVFLADREAVFRGVHPRLPAAGLPGASGPAQLVVLAGDPTDFLGNDLLDLNLSVTERFRYLR